VVGVVTGAGAAPAEGRASARGSVMRASGTRRGRRRSTATGVHALIRHAFHAGLCGRGRGRGVETGGWMVEGEDACAGGIHRRPRVMGVPATKWWVVG